ncbi:hypothetical protein [Streptomyces eurythermus]|nr:hypothetical protein [Streptomyces sp. MBT70]GGR85549.1 hypothetical protein GCM10010236_45280 [Streptomyces eurythermus]
MLEGARLTALGLGTCPLSPAVGLWQRVRAVLGEAPSAAADDRLLPAGYDQDEQASRADRAVKPPILVTGPARTAAGRAAWE